MQKKHLLVLGGLGALIAAVIAVSGNDAPEDPESQVRAVLDEMIGHIQDKDLGAFMDRIDEGFKGQGIDRDGLKGIIFMQLRRGSWTQVLLTDTQVTVQSPSLVDVSTKAVLAQGQGGVNLDGEVIDVQLTMSRNDDDDWRVIRASYTR